MTWLSTLSYLGIGFAFGIKHALDADHLAAISTIVTRERNLARSALVGGLWGIGHTIALLAAGIAVIVLHVQISPALGRWLETAVAVMLIVLGAHAVWRLAAGGELSVDAHPHGGHVHAHPHIHDAGHPPHSHHRIGLAMRPLLVGLVHGMAGSAALMLLVLATIPSALGQLAYIATFGIGSIGGMLVMSTLLALPALFTARRWRAANVAVQLAAALFSVSLGCAMAYQLNGPAAGPPAGAVPAMERVVAGDAPARDA